MVTPFFATAEKGEGFASRSFSEGLGDEYIKNKSGIYKVQESKIIDLRCDLKSL
jgi:hypothetical protein